MHYLNIPSARRVLTYYDKTLVPVLNQVPLIDVEATNSSITDKEEKLMPCNKACDNSLF